MSTLPSLLPTTQKESPGVSDRVGGGARLLSFLLCLGEDLAHLTEVMFAFLGTWDWQPSRCPKTWTGSV